MKLVNFINFLKNMKNVQIAYLRSIALCVNRNAPVVQSINDKKDPTSN